MRIGHVIGLHDGGPGGDPAPRWDEIRAEAMAAERAGYDVVVLEDALTFGGCGHWESMTVAGGIAASTTRIRIGHSVVNVPLRPPAVVARAAETLDEMSAGRYVLGIGAGNTPDDYEAYGLDADPRYGRFAEAMEVIHALLTTGDADFAGDHERARPKYWAPRGPSENGPPIVVAAGGPKMLRLCARFATGWNWWAGAAGQTDHLPPILDELATACEEYARDPSTVERTLDVYSFDPLGITADPPSQVLAGPPDRLAGAVEGLADLGIDEVRLDLVAPPGRRVEAVEAMGEVVGLVHAM